jgi:hypothetical protein
MDSILRYLLFNLEAGKNVGKLCSFLNREWTRMDANGRESLIFLSLARGDGRSKMEDSRAPHLPLLSSVSHP